jgi:nitronate monooxygenase
MRSVTSLLGIELPVFQAPMVGVQDEALALAVLEAGGLGSLPCALLDAPGLESALRRVADLPRPVNLNFFCHAMPGPDEAREARWRAALAPYYDEFGVMPPPPSTAGVRRPIDAGILEVLAAYRPRILSFHFGLPEPALLARIKAWGALVMASATTVEEGLWLQAHGADVVIAQGIEAGGHRGHFLSDDLGLQTTTARLVASMSTAITLPIVAAGGIGNRQDVELLMAAGASAVQAGTAYLLCTEATTSAVHRRALAQGDRVGALTNLFTGRPARGLVNRLMRELGPMSTLPPDFPWAAQALAPLRAHAEGRGLDDFSPLWSGTRPNTFPGMGAAEVTRRLAGTG